MCALHMHQRTGVWCMRAGPSYDRPLLCGHGISMTRTMRMGHHIRRPSAALRGCATEPPTPERSAMSGKRCVQCYHREMLLGVHWQQIPTLLNCPQKCGLFTPRLNVCAKPPRQLSVRPTSSISWTLQQHPCQLRSLLLMAWQPGAPLTALCRLETLRLPPKCMALPHAGLE